MRKWIPSVIITTAAFLFITCDDADAKEGVTCDATDIWTSQIDVEDQIQACYNTSASTFKVSYDNTVDMSKAFYSVYKNQKNEYISGTINSWKYSTTITKDSKASTVTMKYLITAEQEEFATSIVNQLSETVKKLPTDLDKIKYVNDWLSKQTTYSKTGKTSTHSIYTLFNDYKAVCQAYALATYRILKGAGVEVHYVTGMAGRVGHAWNVVKIDGEWYNLDVTWNDPKSLGMTGYAYFLMPDTTFNLQHTIDKEIEWYSEFKATSTKFAEWHKVNNAITDETNMITYFNESSTADIYKFIGTDLAAKQKVGSGYMKTAATNGKQLYFVDNSTNQLKKIDTANNNELTTLETNKTTDLTIVGDFLYYKVASKKQRIYIGDSKVNYDSFEIVSIKKDAITLKVSDEAYSDASRMIDLITPKGKIMSLEKPIQQSNNELKFIYKTPLALIDKGKWQVNGVIYNVLGDTLNAKKALAVDKKILAAEKLGATHRNYLKSVIKASIDYQNLTFEQKEFIKEKTKLDNLLETIKEAYQPIQNFESLVKTITIDNLLEPGKMSDGTNLASASEENNGASLLNVQPASVNKGAITLYTDLTKEQLTLVNPTIKKAYLSYLNSYNVKYAIQNNSVAEKNATMLVEFNKAYKKLSKDQKAILANDESAQKLLDKTLQKNASVAVAVEKKIPPLQVQKKNDKKKLVYYAVDAEGQKTTTETTTKTSYPVMIDNDNILSIMKAKKAYDDLGIKNKSAQELVNRSILNVLLEKIQPSITKVDAFKTTLNSIGQSQETAFVEPMKSAIAQYVELSSDEVKYIVDRQTLTLYKDYLKTYQVALLYDKMDDPISTTKTMKVEYTPTGTVQAITNDVKFSKGKFSVPKANYTFTFKDNTIQKQAYYQNDKWTITIDAIPQLLATTVTAGEIENYAKAFNKLKDVPKQLLIRDNEQYQQYVGKELDYKKAATLEKKIESAIKSNTSASLQATKKAYDALTEIQQSYVSNRAEFLSLVGT